MTCMARNWTCPDCKDAVIGVYEPAVVLDGPAARITSQLNEPHVPSASYHKRCYVALASHAASAQPQHLALS